MARKQLVGLKSNGFGPSGFNANHPKLYKTSEPKSFTRPASVDISNDEQTNLQMPAAEPDKQMLLLEYMQRQPADWVSGEFTPEPLPFSHGTMYLASKANGSLHNLSPGRKDGFILAQPQQEEDLFTRMFLPSAQMIQKAHIEV